MAILVRMKKYSADTKKALKITNNLDSVLKKAKEKLYIEEAACQAAMLLLSIISWRLMLPKRNFPRLYKI